MWREQTSAEERDRRIELVTEVLWAIYEAGIGPRSSYYELFDQLRLQLPDLLDGLSVQEAILDEAADSLLITVSGVPKRFDLLTGSSNGNRQASRILLESRDHRKWVLKRLEVTGEENSNHLPPRCCFVAGVSYIVDRCEGEGSFNEVEYLQTFTGLAPQLHSS